MATKQQLSTFKQLQDSTMKIAGFSSASDRATVKEALNVAYERAWSEYDWQEKQREARVNTRAPYSTGTISSSGTTITGSGTTFTSDMIGMWIATGYNAPPTRIAGYTSATEITTEFPIPGGDLAAGTGYVIYEGEVELHEDCDILLANHVTLYDENGVRMHGLTEADAEDWLFPHASGKPFAFAESQDKIASGVHTKRIKLRYAPDAVYTIAYKYQADVTHLNGDSEVPELPSIAKIALVYGALAWIYQLDEFKDSSLRERAENEFAMNLRKAYMKNIRNKPRVTHVRPLDRPSSRGGLTFTIRSS